MRYLVVVILAVFLAACSDAGEKASEAAVAYYQALVNGDYKAFSHGMSDYDNLPEAYRRQRDELAKIFLEQQKKEHGGLSSVTVSETTLNDTEDMANVYLQILFSDSVNEEVVVPMIKKGERWLMR